MAPYRHTRRIQIYWWLSGLPSTTPCGPRIEVLAMFFSRILLTLGCLVGVCHATALAAGVKHRFSSRIQDDVSLRFVKNSGICETTPGVHQMSGYVDIGTNMSIWFWFFAARTSPETAPFTLWCVEHSIVWQSQPANARGKGLTVALDVPQKLYVTSGRLYGLLTVILGLVPRYLMHFFSPRIAADLSEKEHGPCTVNADGNSTTLNSFRQGIILDRPTSLVLIRIPAGTPLATNPVIYIDQPIGTGFSFGTDTVNSTESAAVQFWQVFQILFESGEFARYQSREFIFSTESYGGHYGPAFVTYFDQQNDAIAKGTITGVPIVVSALMVNNGWYDPLIQNLAYLTFATNAPGYGQLQSDAVLQKMNTSYFEANGCLEQEQACYDAGDSSASNAICIQADNFCVDNLFIPAVGNRDSDDLRQNSSALFPPEFYLNYLALADVKAKIGAESNYSECANAPDRLFGRTGDDARTWLPQLGALANSTLKILIWAGDADINCNWLGGHASVLAMDWYGKQRLADTPFTNMTINGTAVAAIQNVDNFSFARVYEAGHEVPAFQPVAALEIFKQVIAMEQLHSV
ncbi:hypothetical protein MVEN_01759900 [Mycena venus]|uniref:Carboxypeptidase n=1 Tax=Mycena venus TaxID=2733690 RepID=A0A8H6XKH4_9AGAR|nr:hypothetical protein MVEN_01759900 [Mycena venus]